MMTVIPHFNMGRVVQDYARGVYYPAAQHYRRLLQAGQAAQFGAWRRRAHQLWPDVRLRRLSNPPRELPRAGEFRVQVAAALNGLSTADVRVEFVAQRVLPKSHTEPPALSSFRAPVREDVWRALLRPTGELDSEGAAVYELQSTPPNCGKFAFEVRIYPWHEMLAHPLELGLLRRI